MPAMRPLFLSPVATAPGQRILGLLARAVHIALPVIVFPVRGGTAGGAAGRTAPSETAPLMRNKPAVLLALDAATHETGWAVFSDWELLDTGTIISCREPGAPASARIRQLLTELGKLKTRYQPAGVALSRPSGISWDVPALELLEFELEQWAADVHLPMGAYSAAEVRHAATGHPRASQPDPAFAVMSALGLVGQQKSAHEWEAIAVGAYHLCRQHGPDLSPKSGRH